MLWAVAGRFPFTETELLNMPLLRLEMWYRGHEYMVAENYRASLRTMEETKALMEAYLNGRR